MSRTGVRDQPVGWTSVAAGVGIIVLLAAALTGVGVALAVVLRLVLG